MNKNLSDVTVILDRSGSMESCRTEAENGVNHFIEKQKSDPGSVNFTLVQFDNEYEVVYDGLNINKVKADFRLKPRGMTALLDAIGNTINNIGKRLSNLPENDRPSLVTICIITDGIENASQEYTKEQVRNMIEHQESVYNWKFTYIGANQNAFAEARKIGINNEGAVASYSTSKSDVAFLSMSNNVSRMRKMASSGQIAVPCYTQEERSLMKDVL